MIKFKSTRKVPKYDVYNRLLGEFTQRMIINEITRKGDEITPSGFYYYINENGETIVDAPIKNSTFTKNQVTQAEVNLPPFANNNLFDALDARIVQFTFFKWQMENGSSFGLLANEWEIDIDE